MAQYDDLPNKRITVVGLLSVAITIITVLAVQVLYFGMVGYVDVRKFGESTYREGIESLADQTKNISRYGVDEETGRITIPIDQAMKAMVSESAKTKTDETKPSSNDEA